MKHTFLIIFMAAAVVMCHQRSNGDSHPRVLNDSPVTGTNVKIKTQNTHLYVMRLETESGNMEGSFKLPDATPNQSWCLKKEHIVQFGHDKAIRHTFIAPDALYADKACWVSGYVFHDTVDDCYEMRQVAFTYDDPEETIDLVTGGIVLLSQVGGVHTYDLSLKWKDHNVESSDTIFEGHLSGKVTKTVVSESTKTVEGHTLSKGDQVITYKLVADNLTTTQLSNFVSWWTYCVVPSL